MVGFRLLPILSHIWPQCAHGDLPGGFRLGDSEFLVLLNPSASS